MEGKELQLIGKSVVTIFNEAIQLLPNHMKRGFL